MRYLVLLRITSATRRPLLFRQDEPLPLDDGARWRLIAE